MDKHYEFRVPVNLRVILKTLVRPTFAQGNVSVVDLNIQTN